MNPINYAAQFVNPAQEVYSGYATGLNAQGAQQTLRMNDAAEARARELHPLAMEGQRLGMDLRVQANDRANSTLDLQQQQAQEGQARQDEFRSAMGGLAELGAGAAFDDYAQIAARFPEFRDSIMETWGALDDNRKAGMSEVMGQVAIALQSDSPDRAVALLDQYAAAAENSGDAAAAATAKGLSQLAQTSPEAAMASLGATLATVDPTLAQKVLGGGSARVQSSQMIGGLVSVQTMNDGSTRVVDATTNEVLTGQAAIDAVSNANTAVAEAERLKNFGRGTGSNEADIETGGDAAREIAIGKAEGARQVATDVELTEMERNITGLRVVIDQLDQLAGTAAYTRKDVIGDDIRRQLGLPSDEGAIARAQYIAIVDNQVLPLLKQTFGAAFTAKEGETLRATLGDADKSPEEKRAVLNAFIAQKERDLAARQGAGTGGQEVTPPTGPTPSVSVGNQSYLDLLND